MSSEQKEIGHAETAANLPSSTSANQESRRSMWGRVLGFFRRYNDFIVFLLTVLALGLAIDAMLRLREHTETLEQLQQVKYIPRFQDVMVAVTDAMKKHDDKAPLTECYIVTDLIGYGHFSFPDAYRDYETFLSRQKNLQLAVLTPKGVENVLKGQFAYPGGLSGAEKSSIRGKVRRYLEEYLGRAETRELFKDLKAEGSPCQVLKNRSTETFMGAEASSPEFVQDQQALVGCIAAVESLLYRQFDGGMDGDGIQFDGPSSIHIWWFGEDEAIFALTDETGAEVNGFLSTSPQLNRGLRAIAKKIIQEARNSKKY